MPAEIKLEALSSTPPLEIMRLATGSITIGREPENDVVVDSGAVSRRHGCIISAQSQWVFKDLESSNGSWINGVRLDSGQLKLLRSGDVIQVADFPIRLSEVHQTDSFGAAGAVPSLLVFYRDSFEVEFPLATPQSQFVLGGPEGHFYVDGSEETHPLLTITNTGGALELWNGGGQFTVVVNGLAATGTTALADRAEVVIEAYRIIVNDMRAAIAPERAAAGLGQSPEPVREIKAYQQNDLPEPFLREHADMQGWVSEAGRRKQAAGQKFLFGHDPDDSDVNATGDFGTPGRFTPEMSASQRFSTIPFDHDDNERKGFGDTALIIAGVVIFVFLVVFVVYVIITISGS